MSALSSSQTSSSLYSWLQKISVLHIAATPASTSSDIVTPTEEDARSIESLQVASCLQWLEEPLAEESKTQGCVAQSSSEAKYIALASAVKEEILRHNIFGLSAAQSERNQSSFLSTIKEL